MQNNCEKIWSDCLAIIREHVVPEKFKILFEPIRALKLEGESLTIQVLSSYVYEALEGEYIDILRSALKTVIGPNAKLNYMVVVDQNKAANSLTTTLSSSPRPKPAPSTIYLNQNTGTNLKNPFEQNTMRIQIDSQLIPSYTMESFIEGPCNRLARQAAGSIAKSPGTTAFNPLLLFGGSGLGKTHLAHAIGLEVKQRFPEKAVLYVSTHLFQTQFTEAVKRNEVNDFLHFYQLIDVLILDDIQELAGKTATQNTFFHIFNHLHQSGKQLILTCDKSPAELAGMEERLLSRFRWGLAAELQAPDFDTRKEIAISKARMEGMDFSEEIIDYICKYIDNNVRELEGTLLALLAQSTYIKKDLTLDVVKQILQRTVRKAAVEEITVDKIQHVVCDYFRISEDMLQAKTRKREIVQARQLAMYFSKNLTKSSLAYIGNQIGRKDHSTVLYACKAVKDLMATDRDFRSEVEEIQRRLYTGN